MLDIQARLEYARAAVAVLRALRLTDTRMEYNQFARAIGLMLEDEPWNAWYRSKIKDILNLAAAAEKQAGASTGYAPLEFERIITKDGKPGPGVTNEASIRVIKASKTASIRP